MLYNILLEAATDTGSTTDTPANTGSSWWIYLILIVLVVLMLVLPSITNRRRMKEYNQMVERLRVGDEVRTIGGVIGRITKINTKGDIQTFVLETGAKGSKTTMEFDMASVGTVLKSNYVPTAEELEKEQKGKKNKKAEEQEKNEASSNEAVVVEPEKQDVETGNEPEEVKAEKAEPETKAEAKTQEPEKASSNKSKKKSKSK